MLSKSELRSRNRGHRRSRSAQQLAEAEKLLAHQVAMAIGQAVEQSAQPPGTIAAYASVASEPPTLALLATLAANGHYVVLPVCEADFQLSWVEWRPGTEFAPSSFARVMEPVGPRRAFAELGDVQFVLVPALAVDLAGNRLGQGGGYFDRFLQVLNTASPATPTAAVVFDDEVVAEDCFAHTVLDQRVDFIATPLRWVQTHIGPALQ